MSTSAIPIYPKPDDLVLLIDTIIDVAGTYSRGILYRFGTQLGERYGSKVLEEGFVKEDAMQPILGMLRASGWFEEAQVELDGKNIKITILEPFETASQAKGCDFMRGFLAGIGYVFSDLPSFYDEEKVDGRIVFIGKGEEGP